MTRVIHSISELQSVLNKEKKSNKTIGFVPTMGALHEGHLSLIQRSLSENDLTVVSIFVNPAQFGPNEDLDRYPRSLETDLLKLTAINTSILFAPSSDILYPQGLDHATKVSIPHLSTLYCGNSRPRFFDGVLTVVLRLFNIVTPHVAYFGEKDFQQAFLIQKMVEDLFLPISITICPLIREKNGLAMSSRNIYLSPSQKEEAAIIYTSFQKAKTHFSNQTHAVSSLKTIILQTITKHSKITVDYCEIIDPKTLLQRKSICLKKDRILFAGYLGETRLIDTIEL